MKHIDEYGNNINFSDDVLSDMTIKGLLGKWTNMIAGSVQSSLYKYYVKTRNIDAGYMHFVKGLFKETQQMITSLTPVLEDLVNNKIYGMEDIFIAVFGLTSDEVYTLRVFNALIQKIDSWDEDYMWDDCRCDRRLKNIIFIED